MDQLDIIERRRRNLRVILFTVILGTLPLYCLGILLWGTAPQRTATPRATQATGIAATNTPLILLTSTPSDATNTQIGIPTFILPNTPTQFIPIQPTFLFPSATSTLFVFPSLTLAPTLTLIPTSTPFPTATYTLIPPPTNTPTETPTYTLMPPTATPTETPTMTVTATETETATIIPP